MVLSCHVGARKWDLWKSVVLTTEPTVVSVFNQLIYKKSEESLGAMQIFESWAM